MLSTVLLLLCTSAAVQGAQPSDPKVDFAQSQPRAMTPAPASPPLPPSIIALLAKMEAEISQAKPGDTECALDLLAYQYALTLQPLRAPLPDVFYALQLENCGATPPPGPTEGTLLLNPLTSAQVAAQCTAVFYVSPSGSDSNSGALGAPFKTVVKALGATRQARPTPTACVVLRAGTHYVLEGGTGGIELTAADSGLIFTGFEGEEAWVSGGVPLPNLTWAPFNTTGGANIYVANIPPGLVSSMPGLQTLTPLTRARRAQFPNFDLETDRAWIDSGRSTIQQWIKPPVYPPPTQYYIDLEAQGLKTDSTMDGYNRYGVGSGGPCGLWTGGIRSEKGWSYWCSNTSAGGGAGQDQSYTLNGYLGFPMGMVWEPTAPKLPSFSKWNSFPPPSLWGPQWDNLPSLSAYQNPGWFTSTFAITGIDAGARTLNMTADNLYPAGGWQGGRNWWGTNMGQPDNNLTSGPWFVENVFEELDSPGEYWFDPSSNKLFLFYNGTGSPPPDYTLVVSQLEVLFNISGTPQAPVEDVGFYGIAFRDQRKSLLAPWLVPSGGDWALRRAGGLHFEGTERGTVEGCAFIRMDANAVFAGAYNRNLTVSNSEFSWLGMSGVVTHGYSEFEDGSAGEQPWGTQIFYNVFRELGLQEMQSSGWYSGKTPLARLEGNLMFNGPRAMANFNDNNAGAGSNVTRNLVFNTCRCVRRRGKERRGAFFYPTHFCRVQLMHSHIYTHIYTPTP